MIVCIFQGCTESSSKNAEIFFQILSLSVFLPAAVAYLSEHLYDRLESKIEDCRRHHRLVCLNDLMTCPTPTCGAERLRPGPRFVSGSQLKHR